MIKVGICDDEKLCREQVTNLLEQYFRKKGLQYELLEYESGMDFLDRGEGIDLLFLDIEMEGFSGIELKDDLQAEEEIRIIFVTGHVEGMPEAFGKNVYGFLEKPLDAQKLEKYLGRVLEDMEEDRILVLKGLQGEIALRQKDIFYFVSEKKYSRVIGRKGEAFCDMGLQQLEEMLGQKSFFRCHKSYLVNLGNISDASQSIRLKNGESIPVSRRKVKELKDAYLKYIIRKAR
jgi:DNA-binding LytR/AlgR family response regulator